MKKIKIEIQHFLGCPNSPILIERVKEVITNLDNVSYSEVLIDTNEKSKK